MPLENYFLLAPGLIVGRLSVEPWLALVGLAIGLRAGAAWFAAALAVFVGAMWGMLSFAIAYRGPPDGPLIEWAYMALLPVLAVALVTYAIKRAMRPRSAQPAE